MNWKLEYSETDAEEAEWKKKIADYELDLDEAKVLAIKNE
jgi:hypothetical protein